MKTEPVLIHAVLAAVVTVAVGFLVGKGIIAQPTEGQTAAVVSGAGVVITAVAAWLARRKVSPAPKAEG